MRRSWTQNWHIKGLALIAATIFWFFVLSSENTFFEFPDNLTIEAFNVPEGLAVVNELGTAKITVRADQEVYKTLTPENFTVYVDLQGLAAGSKRVDLSVNSKKSDVSVVSINPANLPVVLEELTTKQVPLIVELKGEPNENYVATLGESFETSITLSGAQSVLDEISEAVAILTLQGDESETFTRNVEIIARDEDGDEINQITTDPRTIDVTATIDLEQAQKTVGIKVNVEGLEDGWVSSLSTVPQLIHIQGDSEILDAIQYLETTTITIPEGRTSYQTTTQLILPTDVTLTENASTTIDVTLSITPL